MHLREALDLNEFVDFPYRLFRNNKNWVGELKGNVKFLLSDKHPFWRCAEKKFFVVEDDGKILGRIAGIINHRYNQFHGENASFFGFFDLINDENVSNLLFSEVEKWAKEKGCSFIMGPANPSSNYSWGVLIDNFDEPNTIMMPYNPSYYQRLIEKNGYIKEKDLYAFKWVYDEAILSRFENVAQRIWDANKGLSIEFGDIKNLSAIFDDVKSVYNKAWEKNWGFVPMSDSEIEQMTKELKPILKKEFIFFARENNIPVAFCLMLPDLNIVLKSLNGKITPLNIFSMFYKYLFKIKSGRMLALGVNAEYRGKGIELLMILKAIETARKLGWEWGELSWTLEDNIKINKTIEKFGGKVYKKYRIYKKSLK
ncbi:MAG: acyl-CoA N-acyltransferase [Elusimicrobiota bacterium]